MLCPCRTAGVVVDRISRLETVGPEPQSEVVSVSSTAEFLGKLSLLATSWIGSKCVTNLH